MKLLIAAVVAVALWNAVELAIPDKGYQPYSTDCQAWRAQSPLKYSDDIAATKAWLAAEPEGQSCLRRQR